ncbi:MAG TPA: Asp-tRNA(Asn)/Glu-tRNA(Gln) amidotransferase subunit GatC [Gammaproteobacteria bacterium]|nr:Asp-tRNA(Asn)/Glu-tRNA(Gln) amidotransferase subunit GatC [Gammaproteobacteria bacterium]
MSFTQDDVKKLAYLARLAVDHSIVEDLDKILHFVGKISDIDTKNVIPMQHAGDNIQRCRPDEVTEPNVRELMQSLVPEDATAAGLYLVPKVVE